MSSDFAGYIVTIQDVKKFIMLKNELDDLVEKIMLSQCRKICTYKECPNDKVEIKKDIDDEVYEIKSFVEEIESGGITEDDGSAYYYDLETGDTRIPVNFKSLVESTKINSPMKYTHIIYYSK